ncbi:MAG: PAS domain S-box protein [Promethearchaeota archaeon]
MPDSGRMQGTPRNNSVVIDRQEQRLEKIIETAGVLIIGLDKKGRITLFNRRCEKVTGYSRQEVMGKFIFSLLIPKGQRTSVRQVFKKLITGSLPSHYVNEWVTKSGKRRLIEWDNTAITDKEGTIQEIIAIGVDITEQQLAKEALRESEMQYRLLYENLSDGIYVTDRKAIITMCTDKAAKIFGYTIDEMIGLHIGILFHPDDRQRGLKAFRTGLKTLKVPPTGMEWKGMHKDGSTVYFHVTSKILMKEDKSQGYQFLIRDITKRKNAEIALQKSEERFRDMAESTSDWIWEVDANGVYTYASGNIEEVLGYTAEELLGKTCFDLMPPEEAEKIRKIFTKITAQQDRIIDLENWNLHKDGHLICLLTNGVPILDAERNLLGYRGVDKDVTERKRVETALQESEARYRSLFDSVPLGLYRSTPDGQIIDANPGIVQMLGFPDRESLLATNAADLYSDTVDRKLWQSLMEREGVVRGFEAKFHRYDGTTIWVRDNARAFLDTDDKVLYYEGSMEDITNQKQAEIGLRESESKYRTLVEGSLQGIAILQNFKIVFANPVIAEIMGYTVEELLSFPPEKVQNSIHPEDQDLVWGRFRKQLEGKPIPPQYEFRIIQKDGSIRWLEIFSRLIEYQGQPGIQAAIIDITNRKEAEEALRRSEEQYRELITLLPEGVGITDLDEKFIFVNSTFADMLGYDRQELLGMAVFDIIGEEEIIKVRAETEKRKTEKSSKYELEMITKDGSRRVVRVNAVPMRGKDRSIQGTIAVLSDITESKQAEAALRSSEERYRLFFEQASDVICVLDPQGRFLSVSPAVKTDFGYKPSELIGKSLQDSGVFAPETLETVLSNFRQVLKGENIPHPLYELIAKDGSRRISELRAGRMQKEEEIIGIGVVIRDITERIQMEKALRKSEEKFRYLVDYSLQGILIAKIPPMRIVFANQGMESIIGYIPDELTSLSPEGIVGLVHPEDRDFFFRRFKDRIAGKIVPETYEFRVIHKDRTVHWVEIRAQRIEYEDELAVQATFVDITERKKAEIELRNSHHDLELYASILRHDLGNDLQLIFSNTEVAEMLLSSDSELHEFNEATRAAADRMVRLLTIFARPERDVEKEIVVLLERLGSQAEKAHKQLKVLIEAKPEIRHLQVAGGRLLPMVFNNLFRNAAQHAGQKPTVQVIVKPKGHNVQIDVVDNGPGIPTEIRPRLFQRGVSTTGGGLGLYLGQRILEAYGGSIKLLRRRRDRGAAFRITLPLA